MADRKPKASIASPKPKRAPALERKAALRVSYQGEPGANSHLAAREVYPDLEPMACATFEDALAAVKGGEARYAMIPIENSVAGRIADIHHLLPEAGLHIVGEHFLRVQHQLLGIRGAPLSGLKRVFSQGPALAQCLKVIREMKLKAENWHDTAGSAHHVAELNDPSVAAIASSLAGEIYGLAVLKANVEDESHNMTRFLIMAHDADDASNDGGKVVTT